MATSARDTSKDVGSEVSQPAQCFNCQRLIILLTSPWLAGAVPIRYHPRPMSSNHTEIEKRLWDAAAAKTLRKKIKGERCACTWECAQADNVLFQPRVWPKLAVRTLRTRRKAAQPKR